MKSGMDLSPVEKMSKSHLVAGKHSKGGHKNKHSSPGGWTGWELGGTPNGHSVTRVH
jgi:hypothetical protein